MLSAGFKHLGKGNPCPICAHVNHRSNDNWCTISDDEAVVHCRRITQGAFKLSPKGDGGYHRLKYSTPHAPPPQPKPKPHRNWNNLIRSCQFAYNRDSHGLPYRLGLSPESLNRQGIGWIAASQLADLKTECYGQGCWTFPMWDGDRICGVRLRSTNGHKYSIAGSDHGIFIPENNHTGGTLLMPEGPTSLGAVLDLGLEGIGRPNNRLGLAAIRLYVRRARPRRIIIVGDNDERYNEHLGRNEWPGKDGAEFICAGLKGMAPTVEVLMPPDGIKDVRKWLLGGATANDARQWIAGGRLVGA